MRFLFIVPLLALVPLAANGEPIRIGGETKDKPHSLVRLKAEGVDAKAALLWRVYPSAETRKLIASFGSSPGSSGSTPGPSLSPSS